MMEVKLYFKPEKLDPHLGGKQVPNSVMLVHWQ